MDATRTTSWDDPAKIARDVRELPGLEFLRRLIERETRVPVGVTLGFRLVEVGDGLAVFEAEAGPWAYNPIGSVHGGWYAAVLDAPLGCALHTQLPAGAGYTTLEMKVNLVRPVQAGTGVLRATGRVVHRGRQTAVTEARLEDAGGRLYAHATSTCLLLDNRGGG
ncbi:MAG TPA: PaaI family thioesterase [Thermoanaerobaculales bacterium]|nr:PaaI family thioesterase [Acidobacteriota bacterium]HOC42844.1 PaaI family thioesterase [Thermoanaerobaculales bacterium]HPA79206.1 PaaI family thioesterase [Thermoanaerobaculales bacterium]HQL28748.1 PaaI family thioesterase [Thermoanaerobaculales bacterium]HQN97263.1 PaaI family thioesterase [Thermoanaerobaculales bacterium]